jgi:hypothetical protein
MQINNHDPQYAYGSPMMPMYKGGGDVKETYGLRNAAEQLRERGRGDDTILAHINPQEAGILKLLGGSGTINPHTGLPEFLSWDDFKKAAKSTPIVKDIYKVGSSIGKEIERGVESIARNKYLGPIAQMASYLHPVSAALYAGLAPEGSSFDVKGAAKAAAMQQIGQGIKEYAMGTPQTGSDAFMGGVNERGGSYLAASGSAPTGTPDFIGGITERGGSYMSPEIGAVESAVTSTVPQAINYPGSGIGEPVGQFASAGTTATDAVSSGASSTGTPFADVGEVPYTSGSTDVGAIPGVTTFSSGVENMPQPNIIDRGLGSLNQGYNNAVNYVSELPGRALDYASELPGRALDYASELPGRALDYASELPGKAIDYVVKDPIQATLYGATAYGAVKSMMELEKQKEEADRILADQANKKASDIAWAKSVLRDYDLNYKRLTEEDVRRERGMAMGGIASFDDQIGEDDGMMQGGIAALAKGGLPPRYLRGGGDGMSDSIKANIDGKQEARLADGEFVVPADVVSHLGNGSSNAGAKKLYAMMDRVRRSRTGKTRQAPEVNTRSMMPA